MKSDLASLERAADRASRESDDWSARLVGRSISDSQWLNAMLADEEAADAWRKLAAAYRKAGKGAGLVQDAQRTAQLHEALAEASREQLDRKGNPQMAKAPSAAQIAARERFAAMARSGVFKRKKRAKNPLSRVKRNSPSMATGEAPSKRLKKRRAATDRAPEGFYANPLPRSHTFTVSQNGRVIASFAKRALAVQYGRAYANMSGKPVHVVSR